MTTRLSAAEGRALLLKPKRNKFNARKVTIDGITFDSKAEGGYYADLKNRERAGEVSAIAIHKNFDLIVNGEKIGTYKPDFCFWDHTADRFRCVDVKGVVPRGFSRIQKLMKAIYQINVEVVK